MPRRWGVCRYLEHRAYLVGRCGQLRDTCEKPRAFASIAIDAAVVTRDLDVARADAVFDGLFHGIASDSAATLDVAQGSIPSPVGGTCDPVEPRFNVNSPSRRLVAASHA